MIAVLKPGADEKQIENLIAWFKNLGLDVHLSKGTDYTVLGLVGDTSKVDAELLEGLDIVESVKRISEPYKSANRIFHPLDSVVEISPSVKIGGAGFAVIAGPYTLETEEKTVALARRMKESGADILQGGAFRLRTSPYASSGPGEAGLSMLREAKKATGLAVSAEILNPNQLDLYEDIDLLQVGSRNMQNFDLLRELGRTKKPVLLKRGHAATLRELLMSAEYIMAGGNPNVILCERGIRTFETATVSTLDLSAIAVLKEHTHLPVTVDPGRATGAARFVHPMALAAAAAGADGILLDVHEEPSRSPAAGCAALTPAALAEIVAAARDIREVVEKA